MRKTSVLPLDTLMRIIIIQITTEHRHEVFAMQTLNTLSLPRRAQSTTVVRNVVPRLKSEDLFRGTHELVIEHQGQEYRLRLTRNDKLILNK